MSFSKWWKMNISKWKLTATIAKGSWQGQRIKKVSWDSSTFPQVWENVKEVSPKHSLEGNRLGNYVKGWKLSSLDGSTIRWQNNCGKILECMCFDDGSIINVVNYGEEF
jgi:hypothetical protein